MAKIRSIKPEFWSSAQLIACSREARLLFIGLWNFSDDAGVHPASLITLKARVFPGDNLIADDIKIWVEELIKQNLLIEYEVNRERYWQVTGWKKHQLITRPNYKYPVPQQCFGSGIIDTKQSSSYVVAVPEQCFSIVETLSKQGGIGDRIGDRNNICEVADAASPLSLSDKSNKADTDVQIVFDHWCNVMKHCKAKLDSKRIRIIKSALRSYSIDDLKSAIDGCSLSAYHMGQNDTKTKYDGLELILRDAEHIERFVNIQFSNFDAQGNFAASDSDLMQGVI